MPIRGGNILLLHTYGGCQSAVMFTDDATRMRFGYLLKTKDETAEARQTLIRDEADPLGQSIGTVHCDGERSIWASFWCYVSRSESRKRIAPSMSRKGTPSPTVDLVPSSALPASFSWGHRTFLNSYGGRHS